MRLYLGNVQVSKTYTRGFSPLTPGCFILKVHNLPKCANNFPYRTVRKLILGALYVLLGLESLHLIVERLAIEKLSRVGAGGRDKGNNIDLRERYFRLKNCTLPSAPSNRADKRLNLIREFSSDFSLENEERFTKNA